MASWRAYAALLALLQLWTATCSRAQNPCCPTENIFVEAKENCLHHDGAGASIDTQLDCAGEGLFMLDPIQTPTDAFNITDEGHLISLQMEHIASGERFCLTRLLREDGNLTDEMVALVCFAKEDQPANAAHYFTYAVCLCVSIAFLLATLLVYCLLPQLRDLQGKTVMCAVASMCLGELCIAVGQLHGINVPFTACVVLAFFMYFWMMSTFFWMNVVSFNLWHSVIFRHRHREDGPLFTYYCIYGWGSAMAFLLAGLITDHIPGDHIRPNFGLSSCWFDEPLETWSYFYGPMAVLMTCNIIFFVCMSWRLWKDYRNTSMPKLRVMRFKFLLYMKLFIIMGICWIFELLSVMCGGKSGFWIVMDIVNALHGLFIFLVVVMRKRVLQALVHKRPCGLPYPKSWAAGVDEESETMLAEEMQLGSNNSNA